MNSHVTSNAPAVTGLNLITLRAEALAFTAISIWLYAQTGADWPLFALLFLTPDLFMLGYLIGTRTGAVLYNLAHTTIFPIAVGALGYLGVIPGAEPCALIWLAHVCFDRAMGYGLKYPTSFHDTHLGRIGRSAK